MFSPAQSFTESQTVRVGQIVQHSHSLIFLGSGLCPFPCSLYSLLAPLPSCEYLVVNLRAARLHSCELLPMTALTIIGPIHTGIIYHD